MPLPLERMPADFLKNLEYLFTDIDDTLTTEGLLPDYAYTSLWDLWRGGIRIVPVTGRPAGWCDHIARMWPVAGIIGENGAFYFVYNREEKKMRRVYTQSGDERREGQQKLDLIRREVLAEVPGTAVAADQAYRIADLAIDFREDVPPLSSRAVERICETARRRGAVCKVSSIHVNCWYGEYDKISCLKNFLLRETGRSLEEMQEKILFIGDSPNDEPVFRDIRRSVGVANIRAFIDTLQFPPLYISEKESAEGFSETAALILNKRGK
jgi:HAD superfamily hydrolase (TIGR01484 family)